MRQEKVNVICRNMIYNKLPLYIAIAAFFIIQANSVAADPLDPGQLGEPMSMPLSQVLIQEAVRAGVIADTVALNQADSIKPSFSVNPASDASGGNSATVNVTGIWSINLNGTSPELMQLYLLQNKDAVMGRGTIIKEGEEQNITASGLISGDEMSLVVIPVGASDMYKLNLSLSSLAKGSYTVYLADGNTRSGDVAFTVTSDIFKPVSAASQDMAATSQPVNAASPPAVAPQPSASYQPSITGTSGVTPMQLSGSAGSDRRVSSSTSISMAGGGAGSMSQSSYSSSF